MCKLIETIEDKSPRDIISKARFKMLERYPFFGDIAMNLSLIKDPGIIDAPLAVTRNGYLVYAPDEIKEYIKDFGLEGLITMTAHEILHKILKHFKERDSLKETVEDRYNVTVARGSPVEEILFGIQDAKDNQILLEDRVLDLQVIRDSGVSPRSIASKLQQIDRKFDYTYIKENSAGEIFLDVAEKLPKKDRSEDGGRKRKKSKRSTGGGGGGKSGKKQKQKKQKQGKKGKKGKKKKKGQKKGKKKSGHKKPQKIQPVWARKREKEQGKDQGQSKDREQGPEIVRIADEIQKERKDPHNIPEIEEELAEETEQKGKEGKEQEQQSKFDPDRNFDWEQVKNKAKQYARKKGGLPGGLSRLIEEMERRPQLDWRTILQQWTRKVLQSDYTWRRPADSYHSTGVYLPNVKQENVSIAVAVDTSGSIRSEELSSFVAEVKNIMRSRDNVEIYMIACDAAVHDTAWIQNPQLIGDMDFAGGGGTDFRPVFRHIRNEQVQVDGLVYLTDARGNFPERKPQYPVLWLIRGVERVEDLPDRWTPPFGRKIVFNE